MTVYYVEDDENIRQLMLYALTQSGIRAEGQPDDTAFRAACAKSIPDVVVLDIMLPEVDGLEILRRIRSTPGKLSRVPVMMVTAKNSELDIVWALDAGADEYITKPFGMMEMVSRVRAMLRRAPDWGGGRCKDVLSLGALSLDFQARELLVDGAPVALTMREFDLLAYMMRHSGVVLSREKLLQNVWGWDFSGGSRTVDMHVLTLRQKLGEHADAVETVRGVGYRLVGSRPGDSVVGQRGASMIYYLEDDTNIRDLTVYALKQAGLEAAGFAHAGDFFDACRESLPDLVLLDIMLPEVDGLEVLRRLREDPATKFLPVMMLTAKGTEFDKVSGLDAGADDYLAKPFGMMELVSRVNALLRRAAAPTAPAGDVLECGPIELRVLEHTVSAGGVPVELTLKEFDLLRALLRNVGRVLSRGQLLEDVWGMTFVGETRTVDVHIQTLRQKLSAACPGADACIKTVRGVGYSIRQPE